MASIEAKRFTLDDPRIGELEDLLELRAVPHGGFGLEALDGYLTALVLCREPVGPSEWMPRVWGKFAPRWENEEEATAVISLLMSAWNTVAHRVRLGGEDMNPEALPMWWLPDDVDAEHGDEVDIGAEWAGGFLDGMELRGDDWDAWIAEQPWIADIEGYLEGLAIGSYPPEEPGIDREPLSYRERLEIFFSLPDMMLDLHIERIESLTPREPVRRAAEPGRNDPCPCGSGKKYKKCCG